MAANESRMELARRRVRVARYSIGALATAAFAMVGLAARSSHPATTHARTSSGSVTRNVTADDSQDDGFSFDGGGFISPSTSDTPTIQSGGS
jgi:hypothetical protein